MRSPLQKEEFFQGTRQKWFAVLLVFMVVILFCDSRSDIDAASYLNFLTITGSIFIAGASADSVFKIKAADNKRHKQEQYGNYESNEQYENNEKDCR
jgi:hypothetical protein